MSEGSCRKGDCDFSRFPQIAMGSASELEYHLLLARDLNLLQLLDYGRLSGGVCRSEMYAGIFNPLPQELKAESW
jgi:23S rRNA-intervening sequence protein